MKKERHEKGTTRRECNMKKVQSRGKCIMEKHKETQKECNTEKTQHECSAHEQSIEAERNLEKKEKEDCNLVHRR